MESLLLLIRFLTGIFVTVRLGSKRLPQKHLLEANGRSLLSVLLGRIKSEFKDEIMKSHVLISIVTSDEVMNRDLERFRDREIQIFYGSIDNIPLRHLQAAEYFGLDNIVSVDGDDILCSTATMRKVMTHLKKGEVMAISKDLPLGMNVCGYRKSFLEESLKSYTGKSLETGWRRIFEEERVIDISENEMQIDLRLRFTLDYEDDYQFFKEVIEGLGDNIDNIKDQSIVDYVYDNNLFTINESLREEYLQNFKQGVEEEC